MNRAFLGWIALLCGGSLVGCAEAGGGVSVSYGETARANYEKGLRELKDESYPEAMKYFAFVKSKFPFSRYATLAELRVADTYLAQEKYLEAIDAYKLFVKFHPTHPQVEDGYAAYKVCEAYMKQIPSDWFLVPPGHEKDQTATREALREVQNFRKTYARSPYLAKVADMDRQCVRNLADHELYVARFYLENDRPYATILRLEGLLNRYPDANIDPEVMLLLGKTYLKMKKPDKARETFLALARKYPGDHRAAKAKLYLQYLAEHRN
ncbi:MAG: outer membrane protein assembly factor BamD [Deltaproteobacteria bacterium]|nr:outer membrane protein assembly factor BamD [Deltaproteobacteria bacterium]